MTPVLTPDELTHALVPALGEPVPGSTMPREACRAALLGWLLPSRMLPAHARTDHLLDKLLEHVGLWAGQRSRDRDEQVLLEASLVLHAAPHLRFLEAHQRAAAASWAVGIVLTVGSLGLLHPCVLALMVPLHACMGLLAWNGRTPWGEVLEVSP